MLNPTDAPLVADSPKILKKNLTTEQKRLKRLKKDCVKKLEELIKQRFKQQRSYTTTGATGGSFNRVLLPVDDLSSFFVDSSNLRSGRVSAAIDSVIGSVTDHLDANSFPGKLIPIGSFHSNTRVGSCTEFDYLYEKSTNNIQVQKGNDKNTRRIVVGDSDCIVQPQTEYKRFKKLINNFIQEQQESILPGGLSFGGFAKPKFSGVRENIPAVTLLFRWEDPADNKGPEDPTDNKEDISVDITLAYILPTIQAKEILKESDNWKKARREVKDVEALVHLVPLKLVGEDCWYLTTAVLEAQLFNLITQNSIAIELIKRCKLISKYQITKPTTSEFKGDADYSLQEQILKCLNEESEEGFKYKRQLMAIAHLFLSHSVKQELTELTSEFGLAVNSSAIKYAVLSHVIGKLGLNSIQEGDSTRLNIFQGLNDNRLRHTFLNMVDVYVHTVQISHVNHVQDLLNIALGHTCLVVDEMKENVSMQL